MAYEYHRRFGGFPVVRLPDLRNAAPREILGEKNRYDDLDSTFGDIGGGYRDCVAAFLVHAKCIRYRQQITVYAAMESLVGRFVGSWQFECFGNLGCILPLDANLQLRHVRAGVYGSVVSRLLADQS